MITAKQAKTRFENSLIPELAKRIESACLVKSLIYADIPNHRLLEVSEIFEGHGFRVTNRRPSMAGHVSIAISWEQPAKTDLKIINQFKEKGGKKDAASKRIN